MRFLTSIFSKYKLSYTWRKIIITTICIFFYKIGLSISIPGINIDIISKSLTTGLNDGIMKTLNFLNGNSLAKFNIFAIGIMPYISATIVTEVISSKFGLDFFRRLKKDRQMGTMKLNQWTQYFTFIIAICNAIYYTYYIYGYAVQGNALYVSRNIFFTISIITLTSGTMLIVWLANIISKYGVRNGITVIMFINILNKTIDGLIYSWDLYKSNILKLNDIIIIAFFIICLLLFNIFVQMIKREIPTTYPGMKMRDPKRKINVLLNLVLAGVWPPILANQFAHIPQMIINFLGNYLNFSTYDLERYAMFVSPGSTGYFVIMSVLLFVFTISHTSMTVDPEDMSKSFQDNGIILVGKRPGMQTSKYLTEVIDRLNIISALYFIIACVLPEYICYLINKKIGIDLLFLSGTTIMILVNSTQMIFKGTEQHPYVRQINKLLRG